VACYPTVVISCAVERIENLVHASTPAALFPSAIRDGTDDDCQYDAVYNTGRFSSQSFFCREFLAFCEIELAGGEDRNGFDALHAFGNPQVWDAGFMKLFP